MVMHNIPKSANGRLQALCVIGVQSMELFSIRMVILQQWPDMQQGQYSQHYIFFILMYRSNKLECLSLTRLPSLV